MDTLQDIRVGDVDSSGPDIIIQNQNSSYKVDERKIDEEIYLEKSDEFSPNLDDLPACQDQDNPNLKDLLNGKLIISANKKKYEVMEKLGEGSFAKVFKVKAENGDYYALKMAKNKNNKNEIEMEAKVLKMASEQDHRNIHLCAFIDEGIYEKNYNFLIMTLVGPELMKLTDENGAFSPSTALICGKQILKGLECLHELGYIHADLMPSNFAIGRDFDKNSLTVPTSKKKALDYISPFHTIYIINLGCCINPYKANKKENCGNRTFASLASHNNFELTFKDDLESWFYNLLKFLGLLPFNDDDSIREVIKPFKQEICTTHKINGKILPGTTFELIRYICALDLGTTADYNYMQKLLDHLRKKEEITLVLDWDMGVRYHGPTNCIIPHVLPSFLTKFMDRGKICFSLNCDDGTFNFSYNTRLHSVFKCCIPKCDGRVIIPVEDFQKEKIDNFGIANVIGKTKDHSICGKKLNYLKLINPKTGKYVNENDKEN